MQSHTEFRRAEARTMKLQFADLCPMVLSDIFDVYVHAMVQPRAGPLRGRLRGQEILQPTPALTKAASSRASWALFLVFM